MEWRSRYRVCRGRAALGRDAERRRRHADLYDPGRLAAELRRAPREDLRDDPLAAPFYSMLIRVNPDNPGSTTDYRLRCLHRNADADRRRQDLTFKIRDDVKFHNGEADRRGCRRELQQDRVPAANVLSPRASNFMMVERSRRPTRKRSSSVSSSRPARFCRRSPIRQLHLPEENSRQDPHWYEKNIMGPARSNSPV